MNDPELILGSSSAALAVVSVAIKFFRGFDRRLRRLELGMARIEAHLGVSPRDSVVIDVPPESD